MIVLGFDYGRRRTGVAVGNTQTGVARALSTIEARGAARLAAAVDLLREWSAACAVVGRPLHMDGAEHALTRSADRFARAIAAASGIDCAQIDERLTTQAAKTESPRSDSDAAAAREILQNWLDQNARATTMRRASDNHAARERQAARTTDSASSGLCATSKRQIPKRPS